MVEEIRRCKRCVLPESLPSLTLDNNGICNHCTTYYRLFGNWEDRKLKRGKEFENLLQKAKRLNRPYDCLIPLSGGKDSTYALYLCSQVYGLKCLCVTFDNGFLSEYARKNIQNAIRISGADHMFFSINRSTLLELFEIFLIKCGNFCPACMRGIRVSVEKAAKMFRIPLVISGGGRRVAYLSFLPEIFEGGTESFFKNVVKGEAVEKVVSQMYLNSNTVNIMRILLEYYITCGEFLHYHRWILLCMTIYIRGMMKSMKQ